MTTFKDFVAADTGPLDIDAALEAFRADLATPRPMRPTIILVRNPQEIVLIDDMIDNARACRVEVQQIHRQLREGAEEEV